MGETIRSRARRNASLTVNCQGGVSSCPRAAASGNVLIHRGRNRGHRLAFRTEGAGQGSPGPTSTAPPPSVKKAMVRGTLKACGKQAGLSRTLSACPARMVARNPGRRSLRELALGCPARHLRCEKQVETLVLGQLLDFGVPYSPECGKTRVLANAATQKSSGDNPRASLLTSACSTC